MIIQALPNEHADLQREVTLACTMTLREWRQLCVDLMKVRGSPAAVEFVARVCKAEPIATPPGVIPHQRTSTAEDGA